MFQTILVPLDGSPFSEHALPLAVSVARKAQARLHLVCVHVPLSEAHPEFLPYLGTDELLNTKLKAQHREYLERVSERLRKESDVPVSWALSEGAVADTIEAHVAKDKIDLVVMTTHGRGPIARFWLGSVADELVRRLTVPMLLVRPQEGEVTFQSLPEWKRILIPLDGSDFAEQISNPAVDLGKLFGAEYVLLRVVKPILPSQFAFQGSFAGEAVQLSMDRIEQYQKEAAEAARQYLKNVAEQIEKQAVKVEMVVAFGEHPATVILEECKDRNCDLIAIQTHGRRGLSRLFLGSVADKVIRGASVPVLVRRPKPE
ncbi:MAG: universal stress protein UspA [Gemmatales bacterium]|nr:MAG: universal stress protein UspA [Gemmatales bacterium]